MLVENTRFGNSSSSSVRPIVAEDTLASERHAGPTLRMAKEDLTAANADDAAGDKFVRGLFLRTMVDVGLSLRDFESLMGSACVFFAHLDHLISTRSTWSPPSVTDELFVSLRKSLWSHAEARTRDFKGQYYKVRREGAFLVTSSHSHKGLLVVFPETFMLVWNKVVEQLYIANQLTREAEKHYRSQDFSRDYQQTVGQRQARRRSRARRP